jgi:hypothetical protein
MSAVRRSMNGTTAEVPERPRNEFAGLFYSDGGRSRLYASHASPILAVPGTGEPVLAFGWRERVPPRDPPRFVVLLRNFDAKDQAAALSRTRMMSCREVWRPG